MLECIGVSTYKANYRGKQSTLPLIKYKTLPCLYPPGSLLPCRKKAYGAASKPKYVTAEKSDIPITYTIPKPKICSTIRDVRIKKDKVFETKFGPMDMATVDRLYAKTKYTTFTQKAAEEIPYQMFKVEPPTTTKEQRPDLVRLKGQRYEETPEEWQDAVLWDLVQSRDDTDPKSDISSRNKLLHKRQKTDIVGKETHELIRGLIRQGAIADVFVRKCPGYAGYIPLCPPETDLHVKPRPIAMTSVKAQSYKPFPEIMHQNSTHGRRGHLSRTVTLTAPFNPFNKIGEDIAQPHDSAYIHMLDNKDLLSG